MRKKIEKMIFLKKIMRFFHMSQESLNPKIRFLAQTLWSVARVQRHRQTDRQTRKWIQRTSRFPEFFLQPIIQVLQGSVQKYCILDQWHWSIILINDKWNPTLKKVCKIMTKMPKPKFKAQVTTICRAARSSWLMDITQNTTIKCVDIFTAQWDVWGCISAPWRFIPLKLSHRRYIHILNQLKVVLTQ